MFRDRLVNDEDCTKFDRDVVAGILSYFDMKWKREAIREIIFVDYKAEPAPSL